MKYINNNKQKRLKKVQNVTIYFPLIRLFASFHEKLTFAFTFFIFTFQSAFSQTVIEPGNISGIWTKKGSPYYIKGDINIPAGKTLVIQSGVKVIFKGNYKINVQGNLNALGKENDSIIFTLADTSGIKNNLKKGWAGIRFDRRPIKWDTIVFRMPKTDSIKQKALEKISKGELDTNTHIIISLTVDDLVNDTILSDSIFYGKSSRLEYCLFEYGTAFGRGKPYIFGGAIYIYRYPGITINHCTFKNNRAIAGAAIYCKESSPVIANSLFVNNKSESSAGAMAILFSGAILYNNIIMNNTSKYNGGAILFHESNPFVSNNIIIGNEAKNIGGGIFHEKKNRRYQGFVPIPDSEKIQITRKILLEKGVINTGELKLANIQNGKYINNIICNNTSKKGGGIGLALLSPVFINNTICNNTAIKEGGGMFYYASSPLVLNSILYGNNANGSSNQLHLYGKSKPLFKYNDIQNGRQGIKTDTTYKEIYEYVNNIEYLPKLNSDYSLQDNSPCIDAGLTDTTLHLPVSDIRGKVRIKNYRVDIGAVEYDGSKKSKLKSKEEDNLNNKENEDNIFNEMVINIYPNPGNGKFYVNIVNNPYENIRVNIYTLKGQEIYSKEYRAAAVFSQLIDISSNQPGSYIMIVDAQEHILFNDAVIIEK
jgi:hypothetical protein